MKTRVDGDEEEETSVNDSCFEEVDSSDTRSLILQRTKVNEKESGAGP